MIPRTNLWMPAAAALALLSMGCSDPAPEPAAVGVSLSVHSPYTPIPMTVCPVLGQASIGNPPPTANPVNPGGRIKDGSSGVDVNCAIKGSTSFSVSAAIGQGATNLNISAGAIDATAGTGTFQMTMYTPDSSDLASEAAAPCTFDVSPLPLQVSAGNLFASFNCPAMWNRDNATHTACGVDGMLVLEFCVE